MWDGPDTGAANQLNAHTNLTEITLGMDLLWRNRVSPSKVVMGLAFYSRTFTVSDTECVSTGCNYDSGGSSGSCSNEVGLLSNSEISRILQNSDAKSTLDTEAAVKILISGDQWIPYEDADTFGIKVNYTRSQCMSGVAVWAITQDTKNGRFSRALRDITGFRSSTRPPQNDSSSKTAESDEDGSYGAGDIATEIPRDQCRWTNCGEGCPTGWQLVRRRDPYKEHSVEYMFDDQACDGQGSRMFCCPPGPMPSCQWNYHNGGKCNPECAHGSFEIGSYDGACNNGYSQLACCTTQTYGLPENKEDVEGMTIWNKCRWLDNEPTCAVTSENAETACAVMEERPETLVLAMRGSGSTQCHWEKGPSHSTYFKHASQAYCCSASTEDSQWAHCHWNYPGLETPSCDTHCPTGHTKVALDDDRAYCQKGTRAYCCKGQVASAPNSDEEALDAMKKLMEEWVERPECPSEASESALQEASSDIMIRQDKFVGSASAMLNAVTAAIIIRTVSEKVAELWNYVIAGEWQDITFDHVEEIFPTSIPALRSVLENNKEFAADALLCQIDEWNSFINEGGLNQTEGCDVYYLLEADPYLERDEDDFNDDPDLGSDDLIDLSGDFGDVVDRIGDLDSREGKKREFKVPINNGKTHPTKSVPYINGNNGDDLEKATGNSQRFVLIRDPNDCSVSYLIDNGDKTVKVHGNSSAF